MNINYIFTSLLIEQQEEVNEPKPLGPAEKAKRMRMLRRLLAIGAITTTMFTALELIISKPEFRHKVAEYIKERKFSSGPNISKAKAAFQNIKHNAANVGRAFKDRAEEIVKHKEILPALGVAGVALAAEEPINLHVANKMEDRYKQKQKEEQLAKMKANTAS